MKTGSKLQIGIAGAGLMGRLLAFTLDRLGYAVTLFDRDDPRGVESCGYVAAGMLALYTELEQADSLIFQLGQISLKRWPAILDALSSDVAYHPTGSLVVAHTQDRTDLTRLARLLESKVPAESPPVAWLSRQELMEKAAGLSPKITQALYLPQEAWIDNQALFAVLTATLYASKVTWHSNTLCTRVDPEGIETADRLHTFDWVLDCRGLGAKADLPTLRGVRGEVIWVQAPEVNLSLPIRLMHPRYRVYIVPRSDNRYIIGASEIESEDHSPISVRTTLELLSAAYSVHPGFAEARVVNSLVNCRPTFVDHNPKLIRQNRLIRLNGLYRHGYLLAPALMDETIRVITEQPLQCPELLLESTDVHDPIEW